MANIEISITFSNNFKLFVFDCMLVTHDSALSGLVLPFTG